MSTTLLNRLGPGWSICSHAVWTKLGCCAHGETGIHVAELSEGVFSATLYAKEEVTADSPEDAVLRLQRDLKAAGSFSIRFPAKRTIVQWVGNVLETRSSFYVGRIERGVALTWRSEVSGRWLTPARKKPLVQFAKSEAEARAQVEQATRYSTVVEGR